jgi:hypothetical protein
MEYFDIIIFLVRVKIYRPSKESTFFCQKITLSKSWKLG